MAIILVEGDEVHRHGAGCSRADVSSKRSLGLGRIDRCLPNKLRKSAEYLSGEALIQGFKLVEKINYLVKLQEKVS